VARRKKAREAALPAAAVAPLSRRAGMVHVAAAALALALLASHRCATVTSEPGGRIEDHDGAFHARRAERAVAERTVLPPVFDAFENFPDGGRAVWPPLHDAALALLLRLGGSTPAEPARGMPLAAAMPVLELLGALAAAALLAWRSGGARGAALAAWLAALTPALARRGAYGELDHNATELLGALLLALLATSPVRETTASRLALAAAWGGAVLLAMGFQAGLSLSALVVAAAVTVSEWGETEVARAPALAAGFALAALALPFFASLRVTPDPADPWRLGPPYVLVLAGAALLVGAAAFLLALRRGAARSGSGLLALISAATGLLLWLVSSPAARSGFAKGLGFVGSRDPWLGTIDEFQPLWTASASALGAFLPALLVALVALGARVHAERRLPLTPAAVAFLAFLALGLLQKRFLPVAVVFAAAGAGALLPAGRTPLAVKAAFAGGLLAASPTLLVYVRQALRGEAAPFVSAAEMSGAVMRELTPEPGNPPAWGVLAPWDYGHQILRVSGRAVALDNFGSFHPGFAKKLGLFLETSPAAAVAELSRLRLRYVVAVYPPNVVPGAASSLGQDPARYFAGRLTAGGYPPYEPTELGARTLLVRLHLRDAAPLPDDGESDRAALARFRLIYTSEELAPGPGGRGVAFLKVFELARPPGASAHHVILTRQRALPRMAR